MRVNASAAWKRGEKKEAYALWAKAAAGSKDHREKKRNKNKPAEEPAAPAEAEPSES